MVIRGSVGSLALVGLIAVGGGPRVVAQGGGAALAPGDILVADYFAGPNGNGLLFWVNRATGERRVLSDFDDPAQGPTGTSPYGVNVPDLETILVADGQYVHGLGALFQVHPVTGVRTLISDFGNPLQGPMGEEPVGVAVINGQTLVTDVDAGTFERGALFRVNRATGHRTLVSDFGDPAQGPLGENPHQIARGHGGAVLIVDADAGTDRKGALFRIDPGTGFRTLVSDFGDPAQGPIGNNPGGVTQGAAGVLLVADTQAGSGETGLLFTVHPLTGMRTVLSTFGNDLQGPTGVDPFHLMVGTSGAILVVDGEGGTDLPDDGRPGGNGALFAVNRLNGNRTLLSDFGNVTQGPTGVNPSGIAIVPMVQPDDVLVGATVDFIGGVVVVIHPSTGLRRTLSDFSTTAQGPIGRRPYDVAIGSDGDILVVDSGAVDLVTGLFIIDRVNGSRTLVSHWSNAAQGPTGTFPAAVALAPDGQILAASRGGTNGHGMLLSVDPATGMRTLLSDFGNAAQGRLGVFQESIEVISPTTVLVTDGDAASLDNTARGLLFSVNLQTGVRTVVSDFGNPAHGVVGRDPSDAVVEPGGQILLIDPHGSATVTSRAAISRVHPVTGVRTIISDFADTTQGPGRHGREVALTAANEILVIDDIFDEDSSGRGALLSVHPTTGQRTLVSHFRDTAQGISMHHPVGLAVFRIEVAPAGVPVAEDGVLTTLEDSPAQGVLGASDPNGAALTFSIATNGALGTATITDPSTGAYTYSPNTNAHGTDTFTFQVSNGTNDSNVATITVTIDPVNDAPVASDGALSVAAGGSANGTLGASDIDNDPLTFSIVSTGAKGTAVITNTATGAYTYTANAGASGSDTFTFKADDGQLDSNTATIVVTITGGNQPPVAADATFTTAEDKSVSSTLKAADPERAKLTYAIVSNGTLGTATITNAATGRFTYVPNPNVFGVDTFTFVASDGTSPSNVATVTVTITPVNDEPVASNLALDTTVNTPVTGQLPATDVDGDTLTFALGKGKGAKRGMVVISPDGQVTYTPNTGFTGTDSFTFQVTDGLASASATVTVTVR